MVLIFTSGDEVDKTEFFIELRELFLGLSMFFVNVFVDYLA